MSVDRGDPIAEFAALVGADKRPTDREKWIASLEERATLLDQQRTDRAEIDRLGRMCRLLWASLIVLLLAVSWLVGRHAALLEAQ